MSNDPNEDGWKDSGRDNDTYSHKEKDGLYLIEKGANGGDYIKSINNPHGGWEKYDSEKHGS
jgi:hypothetical protein